MSSDRQAATVSCVRELCPYTYSLRDRTVGHRIPWQLQNDGIPKSAMTIIAKDIGIVMDEARLTSFPLPLCSVAEQVFTAALGAGMAKEDDGRIVKLWERFGGNAVLETGSVEEEIANAKELDVQSTGKIGMVLFVGLGTIGKEMVSAVGRSGVEVVGYDADREAMDQFGKAGGKTFSDVREAAKRAEVVILMVNTAFEVENVLFGQEGKSGIASRKPFLPKAFDFDVISPTAGQHCHHLLDYCFRGRHSHPDSPRKGGTKFTTD